eukprot:s527_g16.t1
MHMHFNAWGNKRRTLEMVMNAYATGRRTFWEVYSGDALLAETFSNHGWEVRTFDISNGWDFEKAAARDHQHLPIEGSSPKIGNRARASGAYQQGLCNAILDQAHVNDEIEAPADEDEDFPVENEVEQGEEEMSPVTDEPVPMDDDAAAPEGEHRRPPHGALGRLRGVAAQDVKRTIMRLHRNLGHPTSGELMKLLQQHGASAEMIEGARQHQCATCELHKRPIGQPVSSVPRPTHFNDRVQADTLWDHVPGRKKISDATTRLLAGRELRAESTEEFIKQLERGWIRSFGPMKRLYVDEHRAWCSEGMRQWCQENSIDIKISPGESHTRLALLERRHQVVRRALTPKSLQFTWIRLKPFVRSWNSKHKLRRALLRRFSGQPAILNTRENMFGLQCTLRPMRAEAWIPLDRAQLALMKVRNRGVTHYVDLPRSNKRKREEIDTEDEAEELDAEMGDLPAEPQEARWQASDDGRIHTRIHNIPRQQLFAPDILFNEVPFHLFKPERVTSVRRGGPERETLVTQDEWNGPDAERVLHYRWTGTTTFIVDPGLMFSDSDNELISFSKPKHS